MVKTKNRPAYIFLDIRHTEKNESEQNQFQNRLAECQKNGTTVQKELDFVASHPNLKYQFQEILEEAQSSGSTLIFSSFKPFESQSHKDLLEALLQYEDVPFSFLDFPSLNRSHLEVLVTYIQRRVETKAKNIKKGLAKKKHQGKLGNPNLKEGVEIRDLAKLNKLKNAILDQRNAVARKKSMELAHSGYSLSDISRSLNDEGLHTRRGSAFIPKSVSRLLEQQKNLNDKYEKNATIDAEVDRFNHRSQNASQGKNAVRADDLHHMINFDEKIEFRFERPLEHPVSVEIKNNKNEIVFQQEFLPGATSVSINLLEEKRILPGLLYLKVGSKGKHFVPMMCRILFRKDLRVPLGPTNPTETAPNGVPSSGRP